MPNPPSTARTESKALFRFAVFVTVFTLVHIKLGANVTSTGSGMAFTDWPLSNGSLWPAGMGAPHYLEHVHRLLGTIVGILAIALLIWIYRVDSRRWLRGLAWTFLVVVTIQGIFGGLGVVYAPEDPVTGEKLRTWAPAAITHGVLAQPTLCLAAVLAFAVSPGWNERLLVPSSQATAARKFAAVSLGFVFVQIAIGAVLRHAEVQSMLWAHVFMAIVVSMAIMVAAAYHSGRFASRSPGIRTLCNWTWGLLILQLVLGFATWLVRQPKDPSNIEFFGKTLIVSSHVLIGSGLFLLATLLLARSLRTLVADGSQAAQELREAATAAESQGLVGGSV